MKVGMDCVTGNYFLNRYGKVNLISLRKIETTVRNNALSILSKIDDNVIVSGTVYNAVNEYPEIFEIIKLNKLLFIRLKDDVSERQLRKEFKTYMNVDTYLAIEKL